MTELLITRGLPASGKTTWARERIDARKSGEIVRLNRDDIRRMMLPTTYREPVHHAEELVTKVQHGPIVALLLAGGGCDRGRHQPARPVGAHLGEAGRTVGRVMVLCRPVPRRAARGVLGP
jgi:hypothetical protein